MEYIKIEATRNGYSPDQCGDTITVGELISILEAYEEDTPIYLSHDEGYTYGNINDWNIDIVDTDD